MSQSLILLLSASALTSALLMPNMDRIISATLKAGKFHKPGVLTTVMQGGNIWGYGVIFISLLLFLLISQKYHHQLDPNGYLLPYALEDILPYNHNLLKTEDIDI